MNRDLLMRWLGAARRQRVLRVALSDYVLNGASAAFGMLLVSTFMHALFGAEAAANATVGVIAALAPDLVGPRRGKLAHLAVAPLIGVPLFLAVQLLRGHPVGLGLFLVPATFLVFLGMAWGKRGAPVAIGVMLVMVFAMSTPVPTGAAQALMRTFYCGLGCALYLIYAVAANHVLNARYRTQITADLLLAVAALLRAHARRVAAPPGQHDDDPAAGLGDLLKRQAALADQLQATRDVVLEAPRTPRRQQLAGMLMVVLEMRDHLVASELDLDRVRQAADHAQALGEIAAIYRDMATDVERLADDLLLHQRPEPAADHQARLGALHLSPPDEADASHVPDDDTAHRAALLRGVAYRARHQNDAVRQLTALARGEAPPDLAVVRAALAVGTGYGIATLLPWGSHDYWVLLTIVVVLRGSLAQTLERRNQRVAGTVIGSLLATGLLALHPATLVMVLAATVAQGVAHAFALRRYTVTAIAASVLGLVQSHMLYAGDSPAFALLERVGDTVLGAGIAWAFAYVLPSWERGQIAGLVRRVLRALDRHAAQSLGLARIDEIDTEPELTWRLARREAYDALSALVQATARALAEPRAVQPPLALLEQLQGHSYQLLGQLSAVKSMLLLRRNQLRLDDLAPPLAQGAARIHDTLTARATTAALPSPAHDDARTTEPGLPAVPEDLPDPFEQDISPWVLRRLALAENLAVRVRRNADQINAQLAAPTDATAT
ncbi:FUSC family protein [Ottowia sp. SB7-C50]|uniref:FUSC family protein n=1 Tax=Ottowia sp. SB7-C50 TaxID=3081231 RepID=UPI0029532962|nr:FUSC family membrane protein [Ottowia sp. SB7-C50]WOP16638.1 FUSC family membrane protein [Ottowia sp. SB7-C50]